MSCPSIFTRLLPHRRQPGAVSRQAATPVPTPSAPAFTVLGFRPIDPATSNYQSRIHEIRNQEEFPFAMVPNIEVGDDVSPPRKRAKTSSNSVKIHCRICFSEIDGPFVTPCRSCKKPQCVDCVKSQWLAALGDHERMPARCCQKIIYHDVAKDILPPAELSIYKLKYDESSTPNPFYCPVPTCSTFIPPRMQNPVRGKIVCHICATKSCFKCRQVASSDHQCPDTDEKARILKSFNYKLCPKCGTGIMRMFGCAHVRCQCGAHWCWDCQRPINACYMKPCGRAREDGDQSEDDGADIESDQEDDSVGEVVPDTGSVAGTSVQVLQEQIADHSVFIQTPATTGQPTDQPQITVEVPSMGAAPRASSDASTVAETSPESAPVASGPPSDAKPVETQPQLEEVIQNLDDPDDPDHEWEAESWDFGEEPTDEYWDVWGCMHRFKDFKAEDVPENWMLNLETSEKMTIECMACFKTMIIEGKIPVEEGPKTFEQWTTENKENVEPKPEEEVDPEAVKAVTKGKRQSKKMAAFECKECGVIHCWWCKRAAVRKLTKYRTEAS